MGEPASNGKVDNNELGQTAQENYLTMWASSSIRTTRNHYSNAKDTIGVITTETNSIHNWNNWTTNVINSPYNHIYDGPLIAVIEDPQNEN